MKYGYARVSSRDQNLERQTEELLKFGISKKNIFTDIKSGKDFERFAYIKLIKRLKNGDLLVIKSIDRLGRNYQSIIAEWNRIVNIIGADILVLDMPLLDTRTKNSSLVGKFISDVVLQVLSFVAENERDNIRSRQKEGIALAKSRGVRFGRPPAKHSDEFMSAAESYHKKQIILNDVLDLLKIKKSTFLYHYYKIYPVNKINTLKF